ncbi:MAG TPA: copper resistance protein NlpE N-terminal domain-containing protein [Gammaproteobacteria bacterium]|nr:copper resistance protein NlpE N-terminal domain-containing protein [Gammaproteobacteria bacterium]
MRTRIAIIALAVMAVSLGACASKSTPSFAQRTTTPDNSANSLDWDGSYTGVVPCADCEGIESSVTLNKDLSYLVKTKYLGKGNRVFERQGTFTWNEEGNTIRLQGFAEGPDHYLVGENVLIQLDKQGNRITGALAENYVLRKTAGATTQAPDMLFTPAYWRLTELLGQPVEREHEDKKTPSLTFEKEGSRINGFGGCNSFSGEFEFTAGNRLRFSKIAATQMACLDMTVETDFMKVLETADNFYLDGQVLVLHRARMAPLARFQAVEE